MPRCVQSFPPWQCTRLECCVNLSMDTTHPQAVIPPYLAVLQADHRAHPVYAQVHRDDDAVQLQDAVKLAREGPLQALWGCPTPYRLVVVLVQGTAQQTQTGVLSESQAAGGGKLQRVVCCTNLQSQLLRAHRVTGCNLGNVGALRRCTNWWLRCAGRCTADMQCRCDSGAGDMQ